MPTPAAIRPYPPEPRGFGPFPDEQTQLTQTDDGEVPPEDGCAYFMHQGDLARAKLEEDRIA